MIGLIVLELSWVHYLFAWYAIEWFGVGKMHVGFYRKFPKPFDIETNYEKYMYSHRIQNHLDECLAELED